MPSGYCATLYVYDTLYHISIDPRLFLRSCLLSCDFLNKIHSQFSFAHELHMFNIIYLSYILAKISEERIWTTKGLVTGEWIMFHNGELFDTCISPNNIQMIKLNRTKWPWLVACAGGGVEKFTQSCGMENWRKVTTSKPRPIWGSTVEMGSKEIR